MDFGSEVFKHIELLLGSFGFTIALFFGIFLAVTKEQRAKANVFLSIYLLAFSLRVGKSLFHNYFLIHPTILNVFLSMLLILGPSLWFYVKYLYSPGVGIKKKQLYLHYSPFSVFITFCWIIPNDSSLFSKIIYIGLVVHILTYCIYALYWLLKQKNSIRLEKSKKAQHTWLVYFIVLTMAMALMYISVFLRIVPYLSSVFLFSFVVLFLSVWALKNPFLFKTENEKYSNSTLSNEKAVEYVRQLNRLMENEKLFLDPELTLTKLSKQIGITSKQLSQAINQIQNQNYSQYITTYRIEEVKRLFALQEYNHYKISAIAYESGFNSISSFNTAFKKLTNTTAINYRQSLFPTSGG